MIKGLNPALLNQAQALQPDFVNAYPFEHIVIDDFLDEDLCEGLLQDFPNFDKKLAINEDGAIGRKSVHEKVCGLGASYQTLDTMAASAAFRDWVSQLTAIPELQYDEHYFGGGTHENLSGQGLDPHVDFTHHPFSGQYRRLNLIIYLNKEWESRWGGNIELHKNPRLKPDEDDIISVEPLFNRAVIFATHHTSWHGFPPIQIPLQKGDLSRKSFALYYYTKEKPVKFNKAHSTIYVDRHMSDKIQAGHTLDEADYLELQRLFSSRDQHLERLYNTISDQMDDLQKLKSMYGLLWKFTWPLRKIRRWFKR
ncbi:2OG-Fe(II) oxygenase [Marinicella sp. W31]|uniref:2OG-Fe(II) oxygenase n=1 Tax=Marinicella sp. W31 TaxID=3023713 RepID=UPI003757E51B